MPAETDKQAIAARIAGAIKKGLQKGKPGEASTQMAKMPMKSLKKFMHTKKAKKEEAMGTPSMYVVQNPMEGMTAEKMVCEFNPLMGIQEKGIGMHQVHSVHHDYEEAQRIAAEAYGKYCNEVQALEEKKGRVGDKLKKAIDQLEKKRKEHLDMAKEDPKNASKHKEHIAKIASQIDDLMTKMERIEKSKKEIKKDDLNESILGTIALGATIGLGVNWLNKKKKQIAVAQKIKDAAEEKGKLDAQKAADEEARTKAREQAIAKAQEAIRDPKNQEIINKIKADKDIQGWTKQIDDRYDQVWNQWEQESRSGIGYYGSEPYWGQDSKDLVKKIEDKIKSYDGGEEVLNLMSTVGTTLDKQIK